MGGDYLRHARGLIRARQDMHEPPALWRSVSPVEARAAETAARALVSPDRSPGLENARACAHAGGGVRQAGQRRHA
jgi:hypothetical protein